MGPDVGGKQKGRLPGPGVTIGAAQAVQSFVAGQLPRLAAAPQAAKPGKFLADKFIDETPAMR